MLKAVNVKEAKKITERLGLCSGEDGRTYYAWDDEADEIYEFDSKRDRDAFLRRHADD